MAPGSDIRAPPLGILRGLAELAFHSRFGWAILLVLAILVAYPGYLIARAKFFPKRYDVTSIETTPEYRVLPSSTAPGASPSRRVTVT